MYRDKYGKEIKIGDHIEMDGIEYVIVSEGPCPDIPDSDKVLYGQQVEDMRLLTPFSPEYIKNWARKE